MLDRQRGGGKGGDSDGQTAAEPGRADLGRAALEAREIFDAEEGTVKPKTFTPEVRAGVSDLLVRYATGIDTRDWRLLRSCFTDDCEADYGDAGRWKSGDEITAWMRAAHEPLGHTLHRITNVSLTADGARVKARSYVDALIRGPGNVGGARAAGFYEDVIVETDDGWRIARREYTMVRVHPITD
jgi:3-phenylpropionate/cinnamic acid dioxygenase small subunit